MRPSFAVALFIFIGIAAATAACSRQGMAPAELQRQLPQIPNMSEVALVDGKAFSLSGYVSLKDHFQGAPAEDLYWMGVASLAAMNAGVPSRAAIDLAAYAAGRKNDPPSDPKAKDLLRDTPEATRKKLDELLARSAVQKNEYLFRQVARETSQSPASVR